SNDCGNLQPGASCTINVTFSPTVPGLRTATVNIADGAIGAPQTIALRGGGVSQDPVVTLSPQELHFGPILLGQTSPPQNVLIKNNGGSELVITSLTVDGDFSKATSCPTRLPAQTSCLVAVKFSPTAEGSRTGSITIVDNAKNSPQTVPLAGQGS